jgi:hypothetical protein
VFHGFQHPLETNIPMFFIAEEAIPSWYSWYSWFSSPSFVDDMSIWSGQKLWNPGYHQNCLDWRMFLHKSSCFMVKSTICPCPGGEITHLSHAAPLQASVRPGWCH